MNASYSALFASSATRYPLSRRTAPSTNATETIAPADPARGAAEPTSSDPSPPSFPERPGERRRRTFVLSSDVDTSLDLAMGHRYYVHGTNKSEVIEHLLRLHGYVPGGIIR